MSGTPGGEPCLATAVPSETGQSVPPDTTITVSCPGRGTTSTTTQHRHSLGCAGHNSVEPDSRRGNTSVAVVRSVQCCMTGRPARPAAGLYTGSVLPINSVSKHCVDPAAAAALLQHNNAFLRSLAQFFGFSLWLLSSTFCLLSLSAACCLLPAVCCLLPVVCSSPL